MGSHRARRPRGQYSADRRAGDGAVAAPGRRRLCPFRFRAPAVPRPGHAGRGGGNPEGAQEAGGGPARAGPTADRRVQPDQDLEVTYDPDNPGRAMRPEPASLLRERVTPVDADAAPATTRPTSALSQETLDYFGGDDLRAHVFFDKYALRDPEGRVLETTPPQMWRRIASELASVEATPEKREEWEEKFYWLLDDFRFIPGGRIMHGAGNPKRVTLLNCYVLPVHDDSIESIFEWMKEAARTYSLGGGVGTDISVLRPRGAPVNNAARSSTGSVSFMELFSLTTGTIGQSGRRGALMITIADSHPDVLDFVRVKRNLTKVRYANISVRVSDAFMQAVESDGEFALQFANERAGLRRTIRARELWNELIKGARDYAEPGLIFWDQIKYWSTSEYNGMGVITTNPCSEIPLEPYGNCCLGNVNMACFVSDPFGPQPRVDWERLDPALRTATRFLDNVLDYNADKHPLPAQKAASLKSRRIGVGFTGLGDMLIKLGLKYDTEEAVGFVDQLFERIKNVVYDESVNLACEKGVFPAYDADKHLAGRFVATLQPLVGDRIRRHGLRNVALLTVPPVGSGAALAGVTSGIEPIFDRAYVRRSESLSQETFKVYHPLVREYMARFEVEREEDLPLFFVTAHQIKPEMRVKMQAAIQKHIDHSISSTVNLPRDATLEDVERVYLLAWKLGAKGITVYRESSREGILITEEQAAAQSAPATPAVEERRAAPPRPPPKVTAGRTQRVGKPPRPILVVVHGDEGGGCEVFVHSLDVEAEGVGRLASLALRGGIDPREVIEQLWRVQSKEVAFDRSSGGTVVRVTTIAQAVALALGRALYGEDFRPDKEFPRADVLPEPVNHVRQQTLKFTPDAGVASGSAPIPEVGIARPTNGEAAGNGDHSARLEFIGICPDCGAQLVHENGCAHCPSCGYSKC